MFFEYLWALGFVGIATLACSVIIIFKLRKLEKFQTGEAHANLELINQSLNRLSEIAEKLERNDKPHHETSQENRMESREPGNNRGNQTKEQKALSMIRQGEDPRRIGRLLGISKSEIDLLTASERLGKNQYDQKTRAGV
jgi:hypothetical protein